MSDKIRKNTELFFSKYPKFSFSEGSVILRADQPAPGIFYLKKGLIKQYVISNKGDILTINIFRPGSFFLMMWAINNTPNSFFFETMENTEVFRAPLKDTREFVKSHPDVLYELISRVLSGLNGIIKRLQFLAFDDADTKLQNLFSYLAKTYGQKKDDEYSINLPLTHKDIATWIGTSRETASFKMEEMRRKGLISYKHHQYIVKDLKKLENTVN